MSIAVEPITAIALQGISPTRGLRCCISSACWVLPPRPLGPSISGQGSICPSAWNPGTSPLASLSFLCVTDLYRLPLMLCGCLSVFILLQVHWTSWTCGLNVFITFENFCPLCRKALGFLLTAWHGSCCCRGASRASPSGLSLCLFECVLCLQSPLFPLRCLACSDSGPIQVVLDSDDVFFIPTHARRFFF